MGSCVKCGTALKPNRAFCTNCGAAVAAQVTVDLFATQLVVTQCPKCRTAMRPGRRFCNKCGASVNTPAASSGVANAQIAPQPVINPAKPKRRKGLIVTLIVLPVLGLTAIGVLLLVYFHSPNVSTIAPQLAAIDSI